MNDQQFANHLFCDSLTDSLEPAAEWITTVTPAKIILSSLNEISSSETILSKVTANDLIPRGSATNHIEPWQLLEDVGLQQVSVEMNELGRLDLDVKSKTLWMHNSHWVRAIKMAEDCDSYNVQLKFQPQFRTWVEGEQHPKLILQTVKQIEPDEELQLWFSEEILLLLQMVYLNSSNIQAKNKFVCHRCSATFGAPNLLKLHVTLECGVLPMSVLWERLASLIEHSHSGNIPNELIGEKQDQKDVLDLSLFPEMEANMEFCQQDADTSIFKPKRKPMVEMENNNNNNNEHPVIPLKIRLLESVPLAEVAHLNKDLGNTPNPFSVDAQIENVVSSLGKAKQGHICLYCGKCYSRKYGLKIHIRTHTGYKPLKCQFCKRPFGDPSNLNKHVKLHAEGNTPYKCELCGKILVRRRDLERHLKSRHTVDNQPVEKTEMIDESKSITDLTKIPDDDLNKQ